MSAELDEQYFSWLYSQVGSVKQRARSRTYWSLLRQLFETEFTWSISNDDNREADGKDLRREYILACDHEDATFEWYNQGCSMLELLIVLARVLSFEAEGEPRAWFWHLMDNLELRQYTDSVFCDRDEEDVADILQTVIMRQYGPDGRGGLFPLANPERDQRDVELWYQLQAYVIELG